MQTRNQALHYWLIEPFTWIFLVFFQPARFQREFEPAFSPLRRRVLLSLRLIIPLFLTMYPFVLLVNAFLLLLNISSYKDVLSFFLNLMLSIVFSIVFGIVFGIGVGIMGSILFGILFGIIGSIALGVVGSTTFGIGGGVGVGIVVGIVFGVGGGIMGGIAFGTGGGIVFGTGVGMAFGIGAGIASFIAFGISYFIGVYRLPLYLVSGSSVFISYMHSRSNPPQVLEHLQRSALHWDERVYLPLPYLKTMLLIAYDEQPLQALDEIKYIATERPLQLRAARAATLEIVMRDLEQRRSMQEIAGAAERIRDIFPQEAKLVDPRWARSLALLTDASQDALRSMTPISLKSRVGAIESMMSNLRRVSPNVAFRDQRLNQRLKLVIDAWLVTAERERERLRSAAQEVGRIDNPYRPAQVLPPHDSLFVGRRDLSEQLENELAKGSRRPTLLLNGERRMGKTSALLQLPYLLGSSYIPVFYNLQDPGIYGSTATFLGTLAQGIHTALQEQGLPLKAFAFRELQEYTQQRGNDAISYSLFGRWLNSAEALLGREGKTLLLAFDEFEKLEEAGQNERFNLPLLLDWFRSIVQFHPRIALLFSGVRTLDEMGWDGAVNWSSYLINVRAIKVTFLREAEALMLITRPVPDYPSKEIFGPGVVDKIMYETGCHPFLIQAVCSALIDNLNVEKREQAELADVEAAVEQILENWVGYFSDLWTRTNEQQRACLLALNTLQCASAEAIQQASGLELASVQRTLQALRKRDLVVSDPAGNYSIAVPIFSRWVENSKYL